MTGSKGLKEASDDGTGMSFYHEKDDGIESFFARNGFDARTRCVCEGDARLRFPDAEMTLSQPQGYCSYTLALSDGHLLQYRPEAFKLDMDMSSQAKAIYRSLAPTTRHLGAVEGIPLLGATKRQPVILHAYLQERIHGVPFSEFRNRPEFTANAREFRVRLLEDLAGAFALSFRERRVPGAFGPQRIRKKMRRGRVGASMRWRLDLLLQGLPGHLKGHVMEVLRQVGPVERSPWCLTHGDLLPGNMMVDPSTGRLTGLIDWAEAEWLPFGVALYGVEEILLESEDEKHQNDSSLGLRYCEEHDELRRYFWERMLDLSCRGGDEGMRPWIREVVTARKLGILLWVGIAFDDGRIDRVIEAGRDDAEMRKLERYLEAMGPILVDMNMKVNGDGDEARTGLACKTRRIWKRVRVRVMGCAQ